MSFVDVLSRASESPTVDYHLCLVNNPTYRDEIYNFFSSQIIVTVTQDLELFETELCHLDKKHSSKWNHPYSETQPIDIDSDEKQLVYQKWLVHKTQFNHLFEHFQTKKLGKQQTLPVEKPTVESNVSDSDNVIKTNSSPQNASDFLLSMAGIFDSGVTDTSANVKTIVTNSILKKHERE